MSKIHQALQTTVWKQIRSLMAQNKTFIIRNQYDETKYCSPNRPIYDINEMRNWFKFCYDMGDVMSVEEVL